MTTLLAFTVLVVLVALERVAELVVSTRNAAWSKERGGVESGLGHYPFMVVLHTGLLVGALAEAERPPPRGEHDRGFPERRDRRQRSDGERDKDEEIRAHRDPAPDRGAPPPEDAL